MKTNQKNRYNNGRYNNRNNRVMITRNTALESSGPCGKLHGTALQLFEKYQAAAKDALIQNDLVLAQTCLQHADHYIRLQNIAIMNEQSMRSNFNNNQNNASQMAQNETSAETGATEDEMPVIETPKEAQECGSSQATEPQDEPKQETLDLSVPVEQMQEEKKPLRRKYVRKTSSKTTQEG